MHRTPVLTCHALDEEIGARLFFKCENFQKVGAFKARGASNAVFSLTDDEARHGVVTHSSGNHGAALAYAAARRGIPAWVVMPENASQVKQGNVRRYGATDPLVRSDGRRARSRVRRRGGRDGSAARASVRRRAGHRGTGDRGARAPAGNSRSRRDHRPGGRRRLAFGDRNCRHVDAGGHRRARRGACERRRRRPQLRLWPRRTRRQDGDDRRRPAHHAFAAHAGKRYGLTSPRSGSPRRKASCARCGSHGSG